MVRIVLFFLGIALAAGAAMLAAQTGEVTLSWGGHSVVTSLPMFALALGVIIVAAILVDSLLRCAEQRGSHA
jgi:HemY protein